jgi:hypothetical protein
MLILVVMKRRNLLKSMGALSLMPLVPSLPASALASAAPTVATASVSGHTYKWAEMIVRAHNKCSPGMLERLLKVDGATASALKSQLLEKGVISAQANSFGIHSAVKPLYEGAFVKPSSQISKGLKKVNEKIDEMMDDDDELRENDSEIKPLDAKIESDMEEDMTEEVHSSA